MATAKSAKIKLKGARFKPHEGRYAVDYHVRLTKNMLQDEKFLNLSANAKILYIYMKDWAGVKDKFEYSASLAKNLMSMPTFFKARDELIKIGFIDYANSIRAREKKETGTYKLSERWTK